MRLSGRAVLSEGQTNYFFFLPAFFFDFLAATVFHLRSVFAFQSIAQNIRKKRERLV
jgi:hypothetical protein